MELSRGKVRPLFDKSTSQLTRHFAWRSLIPLEKLAGFWPYQSKIKNSVLRIFHSSFIFLFMIGLVARSVKEWNNNNFVIVVVNVMELIVIAVVSMTIVTVQLQGEMRRTIFNRVITDLETLVDEEEVEILSHHYNLGLANNILGFVLCAIPIFFYLSLPFLQMYFFYFFGDGSLEMKLPVYLYFFVDEKEYFFHILLFLLIVMISGNIVYMSFAYNGALSVRHNCALFDIVKLRIKRASEIWECSCDQNNELTESEENKAYKIISSAVDLHNRAFELARMIDEAYSAGLFFMLLLNAVAVTPLPAAVMLYLHDSFELFRTSLSVIIFLANFYAIFLQGQFIIDYSSSVFDSCYEFCLYKASKRSRVAILIIMERSLIPCRITGGKMFYLSMETYAVMFKTAISYYSMVTALIL